MSIALYTAAALLIVFREQETATFLAWLVRGASLLWVVGAAFYAWVGEPVPEAIDGRGHARMDR